MPQFAFACSYTLCIAFKPYIVPHRLMLPKISRSVHAGQWHESFTVWRPNNLCSEAKHKQWLTDDHGSGARCTLGQIEFSFVNNRLPLSKEIAAQPMTL